MAASLISATSSSARNPHGTWMKCITMSNGTCTQNGDQNLKSGTRRRKAEGAAAAGGWSCGHCLQLGADLTCCEACTFGKYSAGGGRKKEKGKGSGCVRWARRGNSPRARPTPSLA